MPIQIKRAYSPVASEDGLRVLVDRLWPRGITKQDAKIDLWPKDLSPSTALRQWYHQDLSQWDEFREKYLLELAEYPELLSKIRGLARQQTITLITAVKNETQNHAVVLQELLQQQQTD